jgi:tetratricopeptide (TPR) repeat protein
MKITAGTIGLIAVSLALAQTPAGDFRVALNAAMAAEKEGRTEVAMRQFRTILASTPPADIAGQARLELVRIHGRRAEWFEASEQLRELRKLAPNEAEYAYELGVVYRNLSKAAFAHMLSVAPQSARVEQIFGEQYAIAGETGKAVAAYQRAVAADPKLQGSHLALAVIFWREQKRDEALAEVDKELAITPDSTSARQVRQAILSGAR